MAFPGGTFSTADPSERKYRKYSDRVLLRRIFSYILNYRKDLVLAFVSLIFTAAAGVVFPALLADAINNIYPKLNLMGIEIAIGAYFALYAINYIASNRRTFLMQKVGQNTIYDVRRDAFEKLQKLSPSYYSKRETGRVMSYITNDVDALSDFVTFQLPQVLAGLATIILVFPVMFLFNPRLTLVSLVVVPPLVILTLAFQGKIQESFVETRKKIAAVTAKLQEGISGVRVTQSFVKEDQVSENFDSVNAENLQANLRANRLTSLFNALVQVIEASGIAFVIWYGSGEMISGALSVGVLVAFLFYLNSFFNPIIQLTTFYNSYQSAVTGFDRVLQVLDTPIDVREPETSIPSKSLGKIEFQDVSFRYDTSVTVLKNISLKIDSNEVVAVVGPTGAGKSSLVSLILRFYDPLKGRVLIDGVDAREMKFAEFRSRISIVPQDPFLFQATILDNIRYGRQDAADEEVLEVARKVGLDEFVKRFPEGYCTMINEAATNLSMGQKQMICFARALLRNPKILIMDEATSGVDPVAEVQLQKTLSLILKDRTAIIIAHRLSTIRLADRIVVLQAGEIVEEGPFDELVEKRGGVFANMYAMQFKSGPDKLRAT